MSATSGYGDDYYSEQTATTSSGNSEYYDEEESIMAQEETITANYKFWQWINGGWTIWQIALAYIVFLRYGGKNMTNNWWKVQCPRVVWQTNSDTANTTVVIGNTGASASVTAVNTTWNRYKCNRASPFVRWNAVASYIFSTYVGNLVLWIVNFIWGNNGGYFHTTAIWDTRFMAFTALFLIVGPIIATLGYGTRDQVYTSWFG
jgi:hypothetical protein